MTDLSARAEVLQAEAHSVLRQLDLETAFPSFGPAQLIGSALSGLMVLRDLDVMFTAPDATATEVLRGLATIAERPGLLTADFRDERGDRRPTPQLTDERFYAVLTYAAPTGLWKVDLTIWLHTTDRPHVPDAERLRTATPEQRQSILHLKTHHPAYPTTLNSTDIYTAVLDHAVRTAADLDSYWCL